MDLAATARRLHTEYVQALREMNVDLRTQLFHEFERLMPISQLRALRFFKMRRPLRAFFDEKLTAASGELLITPEMRRDFEVRLLRFRGAFVMTGSSAEDEHNIRRIFDDVMRNFVAETARMMQEWHIEDESDEDEGVELKKCFACNNRNVEVVFLPCRHASMCQQCSAQLQGNGGDEWEGVAATKKCPTCRIPLQGTEALTTEQLRSLCRGNIVNDSGGQPIRLVT
jgi:Zinc finger, C3HC4 type (RING finger)